MALSTLKHYHLSYNPRSLVRIDARVKQTCDFRQHFPSLCLLLIFPPLPRVDLQHDSSAGVFLVVVLVLCCSFPPFPRLVFLFCFFFPVWATAVTFPALDAHCASFLEAFLQPLLVLFA